MHFVVAGVEESVFHLYNMGIFQKIFSEIWFDNNYESFVSRACIAG